MGYLQFVNTKQGSDSVMRFSHGNTLPLTQQPFGMAAFTPQTDASSSWFYHPKHRSCEGVRLTHQPSPWIGDYGSFVLMPQKFEPKFDRGARWSGFRPEDAVLQPHYLSLTFLRSRCRFELTPTCRGGWFRIRFRDGKENYLSVLPVRDDFSGRYDPETKTLYFTVNNTNDEHAVNFRMYVVIRFQNDRISGMPIVGTDLVNTHALSISGEMAGIHLPVSGDCIEGQISTSYISFEQAERNARQDFAEQTFESILKRNAAEWEERLSRIEIETKDEDQLRTFYSCMYRAFLYPHKCYEIDEAGKPIHFAPYDGSVRPGVRYTDNGFWDTYRTVYPFFALVAKEEYREMCEAYVNDYRDCGWLPRWPAMGERGCMPSTLIDATLCDAAVKGILTGEPLEKAFEGMLKHATVNAPNDDFGRSGCEEYVQRGYVPIEAHRESVNLTLDAAYGDWCIATIARLLGRDAIAEAYEKRAKNYKNLFDPETGFMRAKHRNGSFRADFNPTGWGRDYTEGSAWQNSFAVPHDVEGLAALYGSRDAFLQKLNELFETAPDYEVVGYGGEIHEMTEMAAADFGQCAISNQPSFHLPFLYAELGEVDRSHFWTEKLCREAFSWRDDGFPGDEDNGTTALWYVFSTIGIYPLCPGKNEYVRTGKLVDAVRILGVPFDADAFHGNKILYQDIVGRQIPQK